MAICRHGDTNPGRVTVVLQRDNTVVLIKQTPANVCDNCGEYYLSDATAAQVSEIAEQASQRHAEVEIIEYAA
ncbi:MAG TPA: type II toxin-antitoxin system MqsA family antitoxin [Candidatus Hydrogenedentes bacterium]|nr:type II toxin-antitoxin system MqsA family antitoxin [Candidatus Hydrogenedentota bacterium]HOS02600.1 type II toxin-antitoxin system MqsA family antitoxin [Candidatus Hydrogenedentota bacterium]